MVSLPPENEPLDMLALYMRDITPYQPLSRADEVRLIKRARAGCLESRQKLVTANLRFVVRIAHEYQNRGIGLDELIAEGNTGLVKAVERFDEKRGHKFITYAVWWIRQAILKALGDADSMVHTPVNQRQKRFKMKQVAERLAQQLGQTPSLDAVADRLGWAPAQAEDCATVANLVLSLDEVRFDDEEGESFAAALIDETADVERTAVQADLEVALDRGLAKLSGRHAQVLREYFGLGGETPMTLGQIGVRLGLTRERVRQLRNQALSRLRDVSGRSLRGFTRN